MPITLMRLAHPIHPPIHPSTHPSIHPRILTPKENVVKRVETKKERPCLIGLILCPRAGVEPLEMRKISAEMSKRERGNERGAKLEVKVSQLGFLNWFR